MNKSTNTAIILSAGFGKRMLPLTKFKPKPMIKVGNKMLIDYLLDDLHQKEINNIIVNLHYKALILHKYLSKRIHPQILFSDETKKLLDTGGGVKATLPMIKDDIFFVINCDGLWKNGLEEVIEKLTLSWDNNKTDVIMCLVKKDNTYGYSGNGDFFISEDNQPIRPQKNEEAPYIYSGIQLVHKRLFEKEEKTIFSFNLLWNKALKNHRVRVILHDDEWFHVGTPEMVDITSKALLKR